MRLGTEPQIHIMAYEIGKLAIAEIERRLNDDLTGPEREAVIDALTQVLVDIRD